MKNLIIVFFVLISFSSYAQYDSTRVLQVISSNGNDYLRSLKIRGGLIIPTDTPKIAYKDSGAIAYKQGSTYIWTGRYWSAITGGSQSLQDVTDVGSTTTNAMTVIKADDNIAFSVNGTDTQTKIDMGNSVDNAGYMNFHNSSDVETIGFDGQSGNITAKNATLNNLASGASTDSIVTVTPAGVLKKRNTTAVGKTYTATLPISISGSNVISMPPASATDSGYVTTGTQTIAGNKTFSGNTTLSGTLTAFTLGSGASTDSIITVNASTGLFNKRRVSDIITASGSAWSTLRNTGLNSGTNFLGNTDSVSLRIKIKNLNLATFDSVGNVGIGTTSITNYGSNFTTLAIGGQNSKGGVIDLITGTSHGLFQIDAATTDLQIQTLSANDAIRFMPNNLQTSSFFPTGVVVEIAGTTAPATSAILDIRSTSKGLLVPRMTTTQRDAISTPVTSLLIFNTSTNQFNYWDGSAWIFLSAVKTGGAAATDGTAILSSGTATVNTTAVAAGSKILLTYQNCTSCGTIYIGTITAGTSFVINSSNGSDASTVLWSILY